MLVLYRHIATFLEEELKHELAAQDHIASGDLQDSIKVVVEEIENGFEIKGSFLYYGRFVDTGRKAGVKRVPISALIDWIRVKKIDLRGKSEKSMAFAIQTSIFQKGIPTDGDERKKRWISRTLESNQEKLVELIRETAFGVLEIQFNNMIEESKKLFETTQQLAA